MVVVGVNELSSYVAVSVSVLVQGTNSFLWSGPSFHLDSC